ncbi:MAG: FAD:protein FMN transferase [Saprospiraceae bacterium]|nr:FAD:protein FMN transferase [Saprospiraceae bacterium]
MVPFRFISGWLLALLLLSGMAGCKNSSQVPSTKEYTHLEGQTMGTYYKVSFADSLARNWQPVIDSLLLAINLEVSTYIDSSVISRFNQATHSINLSGNERHFITNFIRSREIFLLSKGAFDPTIMPLVNYWGFGYTPKKPIEEVDSTEVANRLKLVGMQAINGLEVPDSYTLTKPHPDIELDFSAIAKGYAVDKVGEMLYAAGMKNILVDIGGEARGWGKSQRGDKWRLGINLPEEEASLTAVYTALSLDNRGLATSGNYRNLYEVDGVKYSHTINPWTGFPERNPLLSVSILAPDCMTADALATSCMVLGLEKAKEFISAIPEVHALFIFSGSKGEMQTWTSPGMATFVIPASTE